MPNNEFGNLAKEIGKLDRDTWNRIEGAVEGALGTNKRVLLATREEHILALSDGTDEDTEAVGRKYPYHPAHTAYPL